MADAFERLAAVAVDPDLLLLALQEVTDIGAARRRRMGEADILEGCAVAYGEYMGIDAEPGEDVLTDADLDVIAAVASRMSALADLAEAGHIERRSFAAGPDSRLLALVETACSATLIRKDGKPAFQLLDFLACLERAEKGGGPW